MLTKRRSKGPLKLTAVGLLLLIALIVYLSMRPQRMPECPHDWDFSKIKVYDSTEGAPVTLKTVNGPLLSGPQLQTNVPEFNDCQRLIIGSGDTARYDSLYAVFASSTYREARARARDSLDDRNSEKIRTQMDRGAAVPMVEILSLGGTYRQLGLKPGFSCLYVFKEGDTLSARLVGSGLIEQPCDSPKSVREVQSGHALSIKRTSALDMNVQSQDIPAVARWEWDVGSNTQVIGFACLDGWCEAGELGHVPDTGPDLTNTMGGIAGLAGTPALRVKGWYDEQRLSSTGHWWNWLWPEPQVPREVVGTIVPVPGLDRFDSKDFRKIWKIIAYVNLSGASQEYHDQQNFVPMVSADSVTTISLCMEDWGTSNNPLDTGGCPGISIELRQAAKSKCEPELTAPTIHWWAKTIPADNADPRYWCIVRRSTPAGVPVPGTARWRWFVDDETTWGRCGGACCSGH